MQQKKQDNYDNPLIIVNPVSGRGNSRSIKTIRLTARKLGWRGKMVKTTISTGADSIADKAIKQGIKHIIVAGGDGTVRQVIGAAVGHRIVIGIVPIGTGNILAKNLHIPLNIKDALLVALFGKVKKIDVGDANGNHFVLIAGMGFDVKAIDVTKVKAKNRSGMLAYFWSGIKSISKRPEKYKLLIDNKLKKTVKAKSVLVANIGKTEAGIKIVPGAKPQSGDLKIGIVKADSLPDWTNIIFNTIRGKIEESPSYDLFEGKKVEISPLAGPRKFECDGDEFPATDKLKVIIYPRAVAVLVPEQPLGKPK